MTDNALKRRLRNSIVATGAARGFSLIALAADTTWLLHGATAAIAQVRG